MKRRTFLTTLILFLACFYAGILVISTTTYRDTVRRAKEQCAGEHYFIVSGFVKDVAALHSRGVDYTQALDGLMRPYGLLAKNQNASLMLYDDGQRVYSNMSGSGGHTLRELKDDNRLVYADKAENKTYMEVIGRLPEPYDRFIVVYRSDISAIVSAWERMKNTLFASGLILSCFLALCLLFLLERLFRPLSEISRTSQRIASGNFRDTRLVVSGNDELTEMARSFNHMADEIQGQMAELTAAAQNRQLFIDNFAHELRTPLTAIYGYAEYIQKAVTTEDDRQFAIECILMESSRIQNMAGQLMELASLRSDQIHMKVLAVPELFNAVGRTMQPRAAEKEVCLRFLCELATLRGDANLLESLLINLIDNGIKACETEGKITVCAAMQEKNPVITVSDNGKGMPGELLDQITEPYYRIEKSRGRRDGGAGLGLAICKQIALQHGGELSFSSQSGKGTTATIIFTTP